ncbi:MAG: S8 family peptidase [bacterium]|nr:S8 family peptidase [bacterium]
MAEQFKHIFLDRSGKTSEFTSPPTQGAANRILPRDRVEHGAKLRRNFEVAWETAAKNVEKRTAVSLPAKKGIYLEFESAVGHDLVTKSLEDLGAEIRLLNVHAPQVKSDSSVTRATIYIPEGKENRFLKKISKYENEETKKGKPKHGPLINSIEDIRLAVLESFWQDEPTLLPSKDAKWCEVWLRGDTKKTETDFREMAEKLSITVQKGVLRFPERTVVLVKANRRKLNELIEASPDIAEFRRAKETAHFFFGLNQKEQSGWIEDLRSRLSIADNPKVAVTILDTGANNRHILLEPILNDNDCHSVEPEWKNTDHEGHGTAMCGVAGYGDLLDALESKGKIEIQHCLESVKILPPKGENDPDLYGVNTIQGMSRVEIQEPYRTHIACMAVTTVEGCKQGKPSSWSAAIDQLASGCEEKEDDDDNNEMRRLLLVSAGNVIGQDEFRSYPDSNLTNSIENPGQSWNALTIGAFTEKTRLADTDLAAHEAVAPAGGLSPFSTTSLTWDTKKWPGKPDILLEGGNVARGPDGFISGHDDLSILTTGHEPQKLQFNSINATSAATARAAWMAAQIQTAYPQAWPETVRGLLVHSAQWTDEMKRSFLPGNKNIKKADYANLLRICGYGVPDLDQALSCYRNSLTLIAQEEIQPFDKKTGSRYCTKDMHLHELPWPKDVLLDLGEMPVTLRITLSYFIEPGPGEVGWEGRYRYASHALRFDLNSAGEDRETFLQRINAAARDEGEKPDSSSGSERWQIGSNGRKLGSIHSDYWHGTAAELATCNIVGVYPIIGWWRERHHLKRWNRKTRYSLIVSIHTAKTDIDIYTPVANIVSVPIVIE